jgi:hypothetical protein
MQQERLQTQPSRQILLLMSARVTGWQEGALRRLSWRLRGAKVRNAERRPEHVDLSPGVALRATADMGTGCHGRGKQKSLPLPRAGRRPTVAITQVANSRCGIRQSRLAGMTTAMS